MVAFRAVLDTNVVLAAHRTENPRSPNREVLDRWGRREFALLYSDDVLVEYAEKLAEHGINDGEVRAFLARVRVFGEWVGIEFYHLRRYPADADDIAFLLCALNGRATHLVSYDGGFEPFVGEFALAICEPQAFLAELRCSRVS